MSKILDIAENTGNFVILTLGLNTRDYHAAIPTHEIKSVYDYVRALRLNLCCNLVINIGLYEQIAMLHSVMCSEYSTDLEGLATPHLQVLTLVNVLTDSKTPEEYAAKSSYPHISDALSQFDFVNLKFLSQIEDEISCGKLQDIKPFNF